MNINRIHNISRDSTGERAMPRAIRYRLSMGGFAWAECPWSDDGIFTVDAFFFFSPFTWCATQLTTFSIVQKIMRCLPMVLLWIAECHEVLEKSSPSSRKPLILDFR